ncbi:MAG: phosphoribosylanthranilate isomerase [Planctomycetota bacterium]|nr:phosphoribosylanthranilate isomerase [Planctomycetota bacterium]
MQFKTKICGVTSLEDARAAIELGADAIGLNFYRSSRRFVNPELAREISRDIQPGKALRVGVFVNMPVDEVLETVKQVGLDVVQFHGDETIDMIEPMGLPVIRAIRLGEQASSEKEISQWIAHGVGAILLDADAGNEYGGTGKTIDWQKAGHISCEVPLILAGGLTPENVGRAISEARPDAVDVASGVEGQAGGKDLGLMREFIRNAREAFG